MDPEAARKSPKAYLNLLLILLQRKLGFKKVYGYPVVLTLDPSSACQLRCPFCATGVGGGARSRALMPLDLSKRVIDELGPYVFRVDLFNWGEPLLNKHFADVVRYAKASSAYVSTSSNLSMELTNRQIEDLVVSGLDKLVVSLDGVTEEKYLKYRVGGNFDLVMHNMQAIVQKKERLGLAHPTVVWQFLVFRHNQEDVEIVKSMAARMGVALSLAAPFVRQEEPWKEMTPTLEEFNLYGGHAEEGAKRMTALKLSVKPSRCDWLYTSAAINANGSVSPCCAIREERDDFGTLQGSDFKRVRNNEMYQAARAFFADRRQGDRNVICARCPVEGQQTVLRPHLAEIVKASQPRLSGTLRKTIAALY